VEAKRENLESSSNPD